MDERRPPAPASGMRADGPGGAPEGRMEGVYQMGIGSARIGWREALGIAAAAALSWALFLLALA